jgi:hypothetical protein
MAEGLGQAAVWGTVSIPFVKARLSECGIRPLKSPPVDAFSVLIVDSYDEDIRRAAPSTTRARVRVLVDDLRALAEGVRRDLYANAYFADSLYAGFEGRVISGEKTVPIRSGLPKWTPESSDQLAFSLPSFELCAQAKIVVLGWH